jgi:hypothetical protein
MNFKVCYELWAGILWAGVLQIPTSRVWFFTLRTEKPSETLSAIRNLGLYRPSCELF